MKGILISPGTTPIIKAGDFTITQKEDGTHDTNVTISLKYDACPIWLKISIDHLIQAKEWNQKCQEAFKSNNDVLKSETIENELEHSMQAIVSLAIAYDAFYASIKEVVNIDKKTTDAWEKNKTARHTQISETIRQGFQIKNNGTKMLVNSIKNIFHFRNKAIHPVSDIEKTELREDLGVPVEWRFACFTYLNSKLIVNEGLKRLKDLFSIKEGYQNEKLETYSTSTLKLIEPIIQTYEQYIEKIN